MGKNKNHNQNRNSTPNHTQNQNRPPVAATPTARAEPTPDQARRLGTASSQLEALNTRHGHSAAAGVVEPMGPTLEQCLRRVEELLNTARAHFDRACELEAQGRVEEKRLADQRRDQDAALLQRRKDAEAELANKKREGEQAELELLTGMEDLAKKATALAQRDAACRAKDAELSAQAARFAEREFNAEQGFVAEKTRILKPVEDEVKRLRDLRDRLSAEIATATASAEEAVRAHAKERAEKWAKDDATHAQAEAEARRSFDESMAREREEKLAALRTQLSLEREKAEAGWQEALARRTAALDGRESELEARQQALGDRDRALHAASLDLRADQEMLAEDRAGLERKVERLVAERTEVLRHEAAALQAQLADARTSRDNYFQEMEARRELDRRFGNRSPKEILAALTAAERERDKLSQQLRERPDARAGERLSELERERSAWLEERAALHGDLARGQGELATRRLAAIELETLRGQKEALEVHKQFLDGAVDDLRARVNELTRQEDHRNPMTALTSLDEEEELQAEIRTTAPFGKGRLTLQDFAADLRHRIAQGVPDRTLYYTDRDVRAFVGGLAMTRLMLLQGISGTGKTSLPLAFANAVDGGIEIVEVQAGWRDRQDLIGYFNAFHRHYYATNFLQALYKAGTPAYRDRLFIVVLDEINLSRPEQFFADFLSALEQPIDQRRLTLVNDPIPQAPRLLREGKHLPIPPNVWFVGTANHDESTTEFAPKTYDRAHVMEMPRKTDAAQFKVETRGQRNPLSYRDLEAAFEQAVKEHAKAAKEADNWLRRAPFVGDLQGRFGVGWGNRLEHQLSRYLPVVVASGGSVGEAMDHLLVTKVLRKLKDRHDVRATSLQDLCDKLQDAWDKLDNKNLPERCVELLESEIAAKNGEESR